MHDVNGRNIIDIIMNLVMDKTYNKIINKENYFTYIDKENKNELDMIPLIVNTEKPINGYKSIKTKVGYSTYLSLKEVIEILNNPKYQDIQNEVSKMLHFIPKEILEAYDKHIIPCGYKAMMQEKLGRCNTFNRNYRDSILYLTDLDKLEYSISRHINKMSIEDLRDLFSLQFRVLVPFYMYDAMISSCDCKSSKYIYRDENNKIAIMPTLHDKDNEMLTLYKNMMKVTENGTKHIGYLPMNTMYTCYFNINFSNLNTMIDKCAYLEENLHGQVIGALFYNLVNFPAIQKLFNIDVDVVKDIERRIHRRFSN